MALFNLKLGVLVALIKFPLALFSLRQLDLHVAKGVFELLVLYFAKSEHLAVLDLRAFLALHSEASSSHAFNLNRCQTTD